MRKKKFRVLAMALVCLLILGAVPLQVMAETAQERVILTWYREGVGVRTSDVAFVQDSVTWAPTSLLEAIYADVHYTIHTPNAKTPQRPIEGVNFRLNQGVEHIKLASWLELNGLRLDRSRNAYGIQVMEISPTAESILQQPSSTRDYNSSEFSAQLMARLQKTISVGGLYFTVQELLGDNLYNPLVKELLKFNSINDLWAYMDETNDLVRPAWGASDYETFKVIEAATGNPKFAGEGEMYKNLPEKLQEGSTVQYWQLDSPATTLDRVDIYKTVERSRSLNILDAPLFGLRLDHTALSLTHFPSEQQKASHEVFSAVSLDKSYSIVANQTRAVGDVYAVDIADARARVFGFAGSGTYTLGDKVYRGFTVETGTGVMCELYRVVAGSQLCISITASSETQLQTIFKLFKETN